VIGQSGKPQTIIIPTGSLGEMSEARIKILEKTLESKLDDHFAIVPKELFEEAQEQAFQEMDADECTEDQCILMIKEILQIENAFKMELLSEDGDTQISITWNNQDQKRVEAEYCEGCKTKNLINLIGGLVEKLVGVKEIKPVVVERPVVGVKKVFTDEPVVQKIEKDKTEGLFVSVGYSGTIITSPDGTSWTKRTSGTIYNLNGVTYGNGLFVTVGYSGTILTSSDGTTWTERTSGTKTSLYGVAYGNNTFVAVGYKGTIITSSDGTTWTKRKSNTSVEFNEVIYADDTFFAFGFKGVIRSSLSGKSWSKIKSGTRMGLLGASHGNSTFIAVGNAGNFITSSDGKSWTKRNSGTKKHLRGITNGNGKFVMVGNAGTILTSPDSTTWSKMKSGTSRHLRRVFFELVE